MAVVLAFRVAILLAPSAYRVVKWEQAASGQPGPTTLGRWAWDRLHGDESDEELSAMVSGAVGRMASVTTFSDPFELRKLQILIGRTSGAATPEDDAVVTFHFIKAPGGTPSSDWLAADFTAVEGALDTFLTTMRGFMKATNIVRQYRWYATGPGVDAALGGPGRTGPPRRVVDKSLAGTYASASTMPPQVALTITEQTSDPTAWGRTYWPFQAGDNIYTTAYGRLQSASQTSIGNAADTFYEACATAGCPVVVYSSAKPERETKAGTTLPAKSARALTVDQVQVDDLFDVIRSRRWNAPLLRLQRAIGA